MRRMYSEIQLKKQTIDNVNEAIESGEINAPSKITLNNVSLVLDGKQTLEINFPKGILPLVFKLTINNKAVTIYLDGLGFSMHNVSGYEVGGFTFSENLNQLYIDCTNTIESYSIDGIAYCYVDGSLDMEM